MWLRIALLGIAVAAVFGALAARAEPLPQTIPARLTVPSQNVRHLTTYATGVQTCVCAPKTDDPNAFGWKLVAPVADLLDEHGEKGRWPGMSYEDGVAAACKWMLYQDEADPMSDG